jgi:hypothetical protein
VHDLHDLLTGREALQHLLAGGALAHLLDEVLDDLEVDVGLEQREADLAHGLRDLVLVEAAAAQVTEGMLKLVGKGVEHRPRSVDRPRRGHVRGGCRSRCRSRRRYA